MAHRQYEDDLRTYLSAYLQETSLRREQFRADLTAALEELHRQYMDDLAGVGRDARYILEATAMLMAGCAPASVRA